MVVRPKATMAAKDSGSTGARVGVAVAAQVLHDIRILKVSVNYDCKCSFKALGWSKRRAPLIKNN